MQNSIKLFFNIPSFFEASGVFKLNVSWMKGVLQAFWVDLDFRPSSFCGNGFLLRVNLSAGKYLFSIVGYFTIRGFPACCRTDFFRPCLTDDMELFLTLAERQYIIKYELEGLRARRDVRIPGLADNFTLQHRDNICESYRRMETKSWLTSNSVSLSLSNTAIAFNRAWILLCVTT